MNIKLEAFLPSKHWAWITERLPLNMCADTCGIMAVDEDTEEIKAAFMMDNWMRNSVQVHIVTASVMVHKYGFIPACCDYIFKYANKEYMYAMIAANNFKSIRLVRHFGAKHLFSFPESYDAGVDYNLLSLHKDDYIGGGLCMT